MILALLTPVSAATPAAPTLATTAAGAVLEVLAWLTFLGLGIALAVIDARTRRLPNRLVALLTAGGALFFTSAAIVEQNLPALWRALAGLGISFAIYLVISLAARGGLGAGDVKLAAPGGLYLGCWAGRRWFWASCSRLWSAVWPGSPSRPGNDVSGASRFRSGLSCFPELSPPPPSWLLRR